MTTIVLAEDHQIVRQGLRALLEREPDLTVVGEAADGREAVDLAERLKPDVLVLDLMLPGLSGLEVVRRVSRHPRATRVVVLSMHANEAYVLEALHNGATAYVLKDSNFADLLHAVQEVLAGRYYLSPPLSQRAIEAYSQRAAPTERDDYAALTNREREVLQLLVEGRSTPEIAARLSISSRTVEAHRASVMRKLGLRTQTDLIRYALRRGLLPIDD